ncbi:MAG: phosphoribosyl-ATP diphosphatase [Spirochaetales bacterium]|nr:MAG: phosphoribosyl-ATP diphosphatase [Spirochaetales bacterium]
MNKANAAQDSPWPVLVTAQAANSQPEPASEPSSEPACFAVLMNRKAFRKSREAGYPWIIHPATGRLLPWPEKPAIVSLSEGAGCYLLKITPAPRPYGTQPPPQINPDSRQNVNIPEKNASAEPAASVMQTLTQLIAKRRHEMPEGSYTTHLFREGLEKIRKKTGEEAVELLLAQTPQDIIYESADLVYHLLVLLEASGLSWSEVTGELERRHTS